MGNKFDISEFKKKPKKTGVLKKKTSVLKKKKAAPVSKKKPKKQGRPKKKQSEVLSKNATANFTKKEYNKLLNLSAKRYNITISKLIRDLLIESKYI